MGTKFNAPAWSNKAKTARALFGTDSGGVLATRRPPSPVTHSILTGWGPRRKLIAVVGKFAPRAVRRLNDRIARKRERVTLDTWED